MNKEVIILLTKINENLAGASFAHKINGEVHFGYPGAVINSIILKITELLDREIEEE